MLTVDDLSESQSEITFDSLSIRSAQKLEELSNFSTSIIFTMSGDRQDDKDKKIQEWMKAHAAVEKENANLMDEVATLRHELESMRRQMAASLGNNASTTRAIAGPGMIQPTAGGEDIERAESMTGTQVGMEAAQCGIYLSPQDVNLMNRGDVEATRAKLDVLRKIRAAKEPSSTRGTHAARKSNASGNAAQSMNIFAETHYGQGKSFTSGTVKRDHSEISSDTGKAQLKSDPNERNHPVADDNSDHVEGLTHDMEVEENMASELLHDVEQEDSHNDSLRESEAQRALDEQNEEEEEGQVEHATRTKRQRRGRNK